MQIFLSFIRAKKPYSTVPGDLKRVLVKDCSAELTTPVTKIYNLITKTKEFPRSWVQEQQIAIPKIKPPKSIGMVLQSGQP